MSKERILKVVLHEDCAGLITAEPVCNANGTVLLARNKMLTETIIERLKKHKIEYVHVYVGATE